jgi:DNA polymerase-1
MIVSNGPDNADIMLIGDYPSKNDLANGFALSNLSYFRQVCSDNGLKIDSCYKTLFIKDEISYAGKAKKKFRLAVFEAIARAKPLDYEEIVYQEVLAVQPNVIVPLGELSLKLLAGVDSINKYRGSILPPVLYLRERLNKPLRIIPTFNNQQLAEDWSRRVIVSFDIKRVVANKDNTEPLKDNNIIWVTKTVQSFRNWLARIGTPEYIVFDIETICGILTCIGFSVDGKEGVCVPLIDQDIDSGNRTLLWYEVDKLLRSNIPKVNQNIAFDWEILERYGFRVNNIVGDTMLAAHLLYPELPKNLGFWTSMYTEQPYYKDEGRDFNPRLHDRNRFYAYNAKDAIVTWKIHKAQQNELKEEELDEFYALRTIPLMKLYKKINGKGILVDLKKREETIAKYTTFADIKRKTLEIIIGHTINLASPQQVQALLYEELKFPPKHKQDANGNMRLTTEEDALTDLLLFHAEDNVKRVLGKTILELIIDWRRVTKLIQYASIPIHPDNRLRTSYKLFGTETGRTSGGKSLDTLMYWEDKQLKQVQLGGSLQVLPKHGFKIGDQYYGRDLRDMYIAPPGKLLVEGDLSQAEARAVAVMAEDYALLKQFDIPPGVHKLTASWLYSIPADQIQKGTNEYHMGKIVRHAANNNMKEYTLSEQTHIPIVMSRELLSKIHQASPNIRGVFHREIRDIVKKTRRLRTPFGRRRDFFAKLDENLYNEAIAYIQQSTISDATKFTMVRVAERLPWAEFVYEGHDSAMAEIPEDKLDEYTKVYKEEAEQPIDFTFCSLSREYKLVIPCELEYGNSWGQMKGIK